MDKELKNAQRWVVKIGSALLTDNGRGLNLRTLSDWADQIAALRSQGREVVLVSSGAVAEGMSRLGWKKRPRALYALQAAAAVGQMGLIQAYESCFQKHKLHSAQILLTHDDLGNRRRYLNARSTLSSLLKFGVIPVVNENDTIATDEIRFGDNDTLAALVANLIDADALIILTDQPGLFDRNPRQHDNAQLIRQAQAGDHSLFDYAGSAASQISQGGMRTKLEAAQRAARSGTHTIIASGYEKEPILRIAAGEHLGTRLRADTPPLAARKQWIANQTRSNGTLWLDEGAIKAIQSQGKSLLSVGVRKVEGEFSRGDTVTCVDTKGKKIARGLVNYSVDETRKISGNPSESIETLLGYVDESELIHRDNLISLKI